MEALHTQFGRQTCWKSGRPKPPMILIIDELSDVQADARGGADWLDPVELIHHADRVVWNLGALATAAKLACHVKAAMISTNQ